MPTDEKRLPRLSVLPLSLRPRGISRIEAAEYIGVSPTTFDNLVNEDMMPSPKRVGRRVIWDVRQLDDAFSELPTEDESNPWNEGTVR